MTPSPELQDHIKIAQRAALRNAQTFQMFTMMCAYGKKPEDALREAELAIDVWGEWEDAHMIEMPTGNSLGDILSKVNQMADSVVNRQRERESEDSFGLIDPNDITQASMHYCEELIKCLDQHKRITVPRTRDALYQLIADATQETYFAGAALMLRMLHGIRTQPFPYVKGTLQGLLEGFNLLAAHPEANGSSPQDQPTEKD